jgi:hypothetical protein
MCYNIYGNNTGDRAVRIQPYEFTGQEYKFLQAVKNHRHLGIMTESLVRCVLGGTIRGFGEQLIAGQETIIRDLAKEYRVTLPC